MEWSHDFCLFCDRQTSEGAYCSQACRVADLEKSGYSEPQTPAGSPSSSSGAWQVQSSNQHAQLQLAPALNFAAYRISPSTPSRLNSPPMSPRSMQPQQPSYFTAPSSSSSQLTSYSPATKPRLSSSSSQSSLSSIATSSTTTQGLSDQAYTQLRDYSNSFDHVRYWKRRVTLG